MDTRFEAGPIDRQSIELRAAVHAHRAPECRADPRQEFRGRERLGYVVVDTKIEEACDLGWLLPSGQDDHGREGALHDRARDLVTGEARQPKIEEHQVWWVVTD